jgi:hypothetical protein
MSTQPGVPPPPPRPAGVLRPLTQTRPLGILAGLNVNGNNGGLLAGLSVSENGGNNNGNNSVRSSAQYNPAGVVNNNAGGMGTPFVVGPRVASSASNGSYVATSVNGNNYATSARVSSIGVNSPPRSDPELGRQRQA